MRFSAESIGCPGGKRYCGFGGTLREDFNYFLSYGIPGKVEGERYKKSPELVAKVMARSSQITAPAPYIVFKRWDQIDEPEHPEVVVFMAAPDVLAGLFTLANFDEADQIGVIPPFGAGCAQVVQYPYMEQQSERPRCVIGLFDPSARPYLPPDALSFAAPMKKFAVMVRHMDESFLTTKTWDKIRKRIRAGG
jgi:hypothetical protein